MHSGPEWVGWPACGRHMQQRKVGLKNKKWAAALRKASAVASQSCGAAGGLQGGCRGAACARLWKMCASGRKDKRISVWSMWIFRASRNAARAAVVPRSARCGISTPCEEGARMRLGEFGGRRRGGRGGRQGQAGEGAEASAAADGCSRSCRWKPQRAAAEIRRLTLSGRLAV